MYQSMRNLNVQWRFSLSSFLFYFSWRYWSQADCKAELLRKQFRAASEMCDSWSLWRLLHHKMCAQPSVKKWCMESPTCMFDLAKEHSLSRWQRYPSLIFFFPQAVVYTPWCSANAELKGKVFWFEFELNIQPLDMALSSVVLPAVCAGCLPSTSSLLCWPAVWKMLMFQGLLDYNCSLQTEFTSVLTTYFSLMQLEKVEINPRKSDFYLKGQINFNCNTWLFVLAFSCSRLSFFPLVLFVSELATKAYNASWNVLSNVTKITADIFSFYRFPLTQGILCAWLWWLLFISSLGKKAIEEKAGSFYTDSWWLLYFPILMALSIRAWGDEPCALKFCLLPNLDPRHSGV